MKRKITQLLMGLTLVITVLAGGFLSQSVKAGVGETIAQTFPDTNLARVVAIAVAGGNVNATLTQDMIDGCKFLDGGFSGIQDITGIDVLSKLQVLWLNDNQLTNLLTGIDNLSDLQQLDLNNNQITSLPDNIGGLGNLESLYLNNNQLISLPESIGNSGYLEWLELLDNLLPTDYQNTLNTLGLNFTVDYETQRQLTLKSGLSPYIITSQSDFNAIDLFTTVELSDNSEVSPAQNLILENYVDENNNAVDIDDYILNGFIQKEETIFAR